LGKYVTCSASHGSYFEVEGATVQFRYGGAGFPSDDNTGRKIPRVPSFPGYPAVHSVSSSHGDVTQVECTRAELSYTSNVGDYKSFIRRDHFANGVRVPDVAPFSEYKCALQRVALLDGNREVVHECTSSLGGVEHFAAGRVINCAGDRLAVDDEADGDAAFQTVYEVGSSVDSVDDPGRLVGELRFDRVFFADEFVVGIQFSEGAKY